MNKDQVKGSLKKAKGKIKETVGDVTNNQTLKYKGKAEKIAGKIQSGYGDAKQNLKKDRNSKSSKE